MSDIAMGHIFLTDVLNASASTLNVRRAADRGRPPRWLLTQRVPGKTRTSSIRPDQLESARSQIAERQHLRRLVDSVVESGCKSIAGARLK